MLCERKQDSLFLHLLFPVRRQRLPQLSRFKHSSFVSHTHTHTSVSLFCWMQEEGKIKRNKKKERGRKYLNRKVIGIAYKTQSRKPLLLLSTVIWDELPNTKRYSHTNFRTERKGDKNSSKMIENIYLVGIEQSRSKSVANRTANGKVQDMTLTLTLIYVIVFQNNNNKKKYENNSISSNGTATTKK